MRVFTSRPRCTALPTTRLTSSRLAILTPYFLLPTRALTSTTLSWICPLPSAHPLLTAGLCFAFIFSPPLSNIQRLCFLGSPAHVLVPLSIEAPSCPLRFPSPTRPSDHRQKTCATSRPKTQLWVCQPNSEGNVRPESTKVALTSTTHVGGIIESNINISGSG